ncbi:MAG: type IX secretion system sortase PorU [Ignavibacteriaceae bacterium]|nr:type IX secretion system sortase PorU [Ignavibacteriaceae bacterium]
MIGKILTIVLAFTAILSSQQDIRILASNQNSIIIEYSPHFVDTTVRKINEQEFRNIGLGYGYIDESTERGTPEVPERRLVIGVPSEFGNSIKVLSSTYRVISGKVSPIPSYEKENFLNAAKYEISSEYYNYVDFPELASFGDYGIARGLGVQDIRLFPVKFDVNTNTILLYSKIVFQVDYGNAQLTGRKVEDELLKYSIINYDAAKYWVKEDRRLSKVANSVLANGQWVKFEAPTEGIYKIDKAKLESFGFNLSSIDPRTIKIYNNSGKQLSEKVTTPRPVDLVENAILVIGESDGSFDQGDYILFYGRGSQFRDYDPSDKTIKRFNHQFSDKNYFWITVGGDNGKRVQSKSSLNSVADLVQTSTEAFVDYEIDKINLAKSGRQYLGDDFSQSIPSRTYMNKLDFRVTSVPINYKFRFVNASQNAFVLTVMENSVNIFSGSLAGYGNADYTVGEGHIRNTVYNDNLPDSRSVLKFTLSSSSVNSIGYLDYFQISFEKELKPVENKIIFFSKDSSALVEYYLSGFPSSEIKVFDVTDYSNIFLVNPKPGFPSGGDYRFQVSENADSIRKYIAVGNENFLIPSNPSTVENSNLRGITDGARFIIISHKNFLDASSRLKNYRENESKVPISAIVIDIEKIYNEFSCGIQDISAVRDFIKYAYDNWQIKPEYFLFMGKGTFDYKNIEGFGDNYIPAWETEESLKMIGGRDSYCTDDFFARVDGEDLEPDLAFGRLTVRSLNEANAYIDKIVHYEKNSERGNWRNLLTLVADDGLTSSGNDLQLHTAQSENLTITSIPASFDLKKIYLADYPAVITGNGRRKPAVNTEILKIMNQGTLMVNYVGHGNPDVWAHEFVFERGVAIPQLKNDKYFFLCAATCDFGIYDVPNYRSGAEDLLFLKDAGAIATFSASRLVYSGLNSTLNRVFLDYLFKEPREEFNLPVTLGYAVYRTKIDLNQVNDQKFHLLGDPTLRLNMPQYFGSIDSINGQLLSADVQVRALSNTKIAGTILKPDGTKWTEYNGEGLLTVFDSERIKLLEEINNYPMRIQGGIIFRGRVSVTGGDFEAEFVVPKDISYENKNGKIIFYFFDLESDGLAYTNKIIVGGTDTTAVNDGEGPEIEIFFDNAAYISSYLVGPDPNLIVRLFDETGLNTTGTGVGHKLEGILNKNQGSPIDFTDYFVGELDAGGKKGEINYKFNKMNDGDYSIEVKAWDVFNNFSNEESFFTVVSTNDLVVRDIYNYPNPFSSNTSFTFQHNLSRPVDVKINVYTIAGRLIKQIEEKNINQKFVKINWDGRDEDGDQLGNGTYLYKLIVKTTDGEFTQSVLGKMAVVK